MKKWYAILLLLSALKVSAQEISFIPEVGLGLSNITNSDNNSKVRPGFNIGMGMEVIWNERVGMGIGVNYLVLGNRFQLITSLIRPSWITSVYRFTQKDMCTKGCLYLQVPSSVLM